MKDIDHSLFPERLIRKIVFIQIYNNIKNNGCQSSFEFRRPHFLLIDIIREGAGEELFRPLNQGISSSGAFDKPNEKAGVGKTFGWLVRAWAFIDNRSYCAKMILIGNLSHPPPEMGLEGKAVGSEEK